MTEYDLVVLSYKLFVVLVIATGVSANALQLPITDNVVINWNYYRKKIQYSNHIGSILMAVMILQQGVFLSEVLGLLVLISPLSTAYFTFGFRCALPAE